MCRFGNGTECLLNALGDSYVGSDEIQTEIDRSFRPPHWASVAQQNRAAEAQPSLGAKAPWRRTGTSSSWWWVGSRPCGSATVTRAAYSSGSQSGGSPLAEMGGIVIWRIILCRAGRGGGECMPAASPQRKRTTPAASSSAGWSLCAGSSTSSTSPCPKRSGSSRSSQTESTSTGCAFAAGWPPGTPHFPPLDPTSLPPRIHPYSPPAHSTQALLRLPQPLAQPRAHPLPRLDDDDRRPRGEPPPVANPTPSPYTSSRPAPQPCP